MGQCVCAYMPVSVYVDGPFVSVSNALFCVYVPWLVLPPLRVFIGEVIIKSAGKKLWQTAWVKKHCK